MGADTGQVTYLTAAQKPVSALRVSDLRYVQRQVARPEIPMWRRLGCPPDLAAALRRSPLAGDVDWLAGKFSRPALRALLERDWSRASRIALLRFLAAQEEDLTRLRGYITRTKLGVSDIHRLMSFHVPSGLVVRWCTAQPDPQRAEARLVQIVMASLLFHGLEEDEVADWIRFAVRHRLVAPLPSNDRSGDEQFLGGDTLLFLTAGLTPTHAEGLTRAGTVDRAGLATLATLRAGAS